MSKPINFAVLGCGDIARSVMGPAVSLVEGLVPYAAAARDLDRAQKFADDFGFKKAYGSYDELLADPEVDIVYVAVPNTLHSEIAIKCLEAGKGVFVEKPFAANAEQAKMIFDKAEEKGLFCCEGLWARYVPVVKKLKEVVRSGLIGEVGAVRGEIGYYLTQERLFDRDMAGGALLDIGIYQCMLAEVIFGGKIESIAANAHMLDCGVDETTTFSIRYEGGKIANHTVSMGYMSSNTATIFGSDGFIDIENANLFLSAKAYTKPKENNAKVYDCIGKQIAEFTNNEVGSLYYWELESLVKAYNEGRKDTPECPRNETIRRIEILDEIRKQIGLKFPCDNF